MKPLHSFCWILCSAVALVSFTSSNHADTRKGYVAHEWGTFTSLQAPDGELLSWDAGSPTDLPKFVYDWTNPGNGRMPAGMLAFNKSRAALQRMETPVVYLYGDGGQNVDALVNFPKGTITEWYPHAQDIGPSSTPIKRADGSQTEETNLKSMVRWQTTILSKKESAAARLPTGNSDNHYFAARETDAALLRVNGPEAKTAEVEKFLFYRGIGNFGTPLKVTGDGAKITVANIGTDPLKHLFVYTVQNGSGQFISIEQLAPGESKSVEFIGKSEPLSKLTPQISRKLVAGLRKQGLYGAEAKAMVKTWQASWFEEEGTRVLYSLPEKWTEEILPMTLNPKPRELVRVMVGRAELIRPDTQQKLVDLLTQAKEQKKDVSKEIGSLLKPFPRFSFAMFSHARRQVDPKFLSPELGSLYSMAFPPRNLLDVANKTTEDLFPNR